ncbi:MAG: TPM domain-containing protein [bacterium]|nr:TPM domain-containing protein [bacterium]
MKRTLLCLLLLLAIATPLRAQDYPEPDGFVTDTADMLSAATEKQLEQQLFDYKELTTVEIAVVTVPTLGGVDSDKYTLNLANRWGVGNATSNTGVTLLLAKKERKLSLWFGDGYASSWSKRTSQSIRDITMVPQLKAGKPDVAVTRGVETIMAELSAAGYEGTASGTSTNATAPIPPAANLAPALVVTPLTPAQVQQRRLTGGGVLGGLVLLIVGIVQRNRSRRRRELQTEIDALAESLTHNLEQIRPAEEKLRGGYPESMWGPALSGINAAAMERVLYTDAKRMGNKALSRQRDELRAAVGRVENVLGLLRRAEQAKENAPRLLRELPAEVEAVRVALNNTEVLPETAALLAPLEVRLRELTAAVPAGDNTTTDWAALGDSAAKLQAGLAELRTRGERDIAQVREARAQVPQLLHDATAQLSALREQNGGRYSDVDGSLDEAQRLLAYGSGYNEALSSQQLMQLFHALNSALQHTQQAGQTYQQHTAPGPSSNPFSGGSSGRSGGGSFGGGSSGRGCGGGSSSW